MTVLDVANLSVRRGGRAVISGLSFAAARGEVVALMGPSGTGKTTVLRAIAGLEPIAGGTISVDGVRLAAGGPRDRAVRALGSRVGMVFQFHHLFAHLSALDNVTLAPVHVRRTARAEAELRARRLLERLGVADRASALPHELSGGESQRVAIARALAMDPLVLLLDEPTASLDPARRDELARTLDQLAQEGRTIVMATHDAEFAGACTSRVLAIDGARVQ